MELNDSFQLDSGDVLLMANAKGFTVIELKRHTSPILDNIVEVWKYDNRKKTDKFKGESSWIIFKDLPSHLRYYKSLGFNQISLETKDQKKSKTK
jgi:hypothetical protein